MRAIGVSTIFASLLVASIAYAEDGRRGTVTNIDEASGSITIQDRLDGTVGSSTGTNAAKFAVQDGLVFNDLTQGDEVTFTSQEINGVNTITRIQKQ
jgi:Cu/Ag efflux protein CusF